MTQDAELQLTETFDYGGQPVRYGVVGKGSPLVFVHGTPFSSAVWRKIVPYFAGRHRVYFYDLLGYGQSEMAESQDVSLGIQNKVFTSLLEHWRLDEPDVVGHDFGGATVLRSHLLDGRNYRSLTLIDPVAVAPWGTPLIRHARQHEAAFAGLPAYVHQAIVPAYIASSGRKPLAADNMSIYTRPWLGEKGQHAFYRQIAQMDERYTDEIEARYHEIRCPVMILWGEEDRWISVEHGRKLAAKISDSILKVIPGAGHIVQDDAPEAIVAALYDFLPRSAA